MAKREMPVPADSPRVLVLHPPLAPYRVDLFNAISSACILRIVFLSDHLPDLRLDQAALRLRLTAEHSFLRGGASVFGRAIPFGYTEEVKAFRPDIVITSEFGAATLAVVMGAAGVATRVAHLVWTDDNPESVRFDSIIRKAARAIALRRVAGVITVSEEAAALYRQRYQFSRPIASVPILRDEREFRRHLQAAGDEAVELACAHGLVGTRVLLFVGRLAPEKGLDLLLNVFREVADRMDKVQLVLVGDGPERGPLQRLAASLGIARKTIFAGHAEGSRLMAWYRLGSVFVLPSVLERFGAVVNEALLAGMPVICSACAGARVLIQERDNGIVVDVRNPAEFAGAIIRLLEDAGLVTVEGMSDIRANRMRITFESAARNFASLLRTSFQPVS